MKRAHVAVSALVAAVPFLVPAGVIGARRPRIAWTGDRALTELAVREAAHFHQLLGMGGRFGWRHPGPIWLYLLVPAYELTGRAPWSLSVGVIALHVVFVSVAVLVTGWAAGPRAAAVLAGLATVYVFATGLTYWTNLWAGYAFTFPVLALVALVAAATARREAGWALAAAALVGTFLVQTDVSTVVVVVAVGLAGAGLRAGRFGLKSMVAGPAAWGLAALVAAAWIPPAVEELSHHPGNLTLLARFAVRRSGGYPLRTAMGATGAALSVLPVGARWVLRNGVENRLGAGPWWAVALTAAYLVVMAGATAGAWRRERRFAGDLAAITGVAILAAVFAMSRVTGPISFYLLTWITVLPVTGLAAVILTVAPGGREGTLGLLGAAAVVAGLIVARSGTVHDYDRHASAVAMDATGRVASVLGPAAGGRVRVHVVTADTWQVAAGVGLQLERGGARLEVDDDWVFLFGDAFRSGASPPTGEVWFARPHELPLVTALPGVVDLGNVDGVELLVRRD